MIELRIQQGGRLPDIICMLTSDSQLKPDWLIQYFEESISKGVVFCSEETVQVGWGMLLLKDNGRNELVIYEPDYLSMPIQWINSINNTVRHLALQRSVCDAMSVDLDLPFLRQAGHCLNFLQKGDIVLSRENSKDNYSGWIVKYGNESDMREEMKSLYEIAISDSRLISFFGLPIGSVININVDFIEINYKKYSVSTSNNVFLRRLLDSWKSEFTGQS